MTSLEKKIIDYVEINKEELYKELSYLLRFDSTNYITWGKELECAEYIADEYRKLGLEPDLYCPDNIPGLTSHPEYLPGRGTDKRPNVTAILKGTKGNGSAMLAAHIDTVSIGDPAAWKHDPFGGEISDGRIWGRGAGDDKSGIAMSLFAMRTLKALNIKLKKDVLFTAYCDEESGGGNGALAACLKYPCDAYINIDGGTKCDVVSPGGGCFRLRIHTKEATATAVPVVKALYRAVEELLPLGEEIRKGLAEHPMLNRPELVDNAFRLLSFKTGGSGVMLDRGELTFGIYTIIQKEEMLRRLKEIEDRLGSEWDALGVETSGFELYTRYFIYAEGEQQGSNLEFLRAMKDVYKEPATMLGARALSDLSIFLACGSPSSLNTGITRAAHLPGGAHQVDEYIECEHLVRHTQSILLFLLRYCGVDKE